MTKQMKPVKSLAERFALHLDRRCRELNERYVKHMKDKYGNRHEVAVELKKFGSGNVKNKMKKLNEWR